MTRSCLFCKVVALSAVLMSVGSASVWAEIESKTITYADGDTALKGLMVWDGARKAKRPGILVVYEWWGHTEESEERARRVAAAGYVAFVPDMYGDGKSTNDPKQARVWMKEVVGDKELWNRRAQLGLDVLRRQPQVDGGKLAVMGSSFGGATALQMAYAGHDVKAAVSIASSLPPAPESVSSIKPRVLVFHGQDDTYVKDERIAAFKAGLVRAGADWEMTIYSGAVHSFATPVADSHGISNMLYNAMADRRSWAAMMSLFEEVFE